MSEPLQLAPGVQVLGQADPSSEQSRPASVRWPPTVVTYLLAVFVSASVVVLAGLAGSWTFAATVRWYDEGFAQVQASRGEVRMTSALGSALQTVPVLGVMGGVLLGALAAGVFSSALGGAKALAEWRRSIGRQRGLAWGQAAIVGSFVAGALTAWAVAVRVRVLFDSAPLLGYGVALVGAVAWSFAMHRLSIRLKRFRKRLVKRRRRAARAARTTAAPSSTPAGGWGPGSADDLAAWAQVPGEVRPAPMVVGGVNYEGAER